MGCKFGKIDTSTNILAKELIIIYLEGKLFNNAILFLFCILINLRWCHTRMCGLLVSVLQMYNIEKTVLRGTTFIFLCCSNGSKISEHIGWKIIYVTTCKSYLLLNIWFFVLSKNDWIVLLQKEHAVAQIKLFCCCENLVVLQQICCEKSCPS